MTFKNGIALTPGMKTCVKYLADHEHLKLHCILGRHRPIIVTVREACDMGLGDHTVLSNGRVYVTGNQYSRFNIQRSRNEAQPGT